MRKSPNHFQAAVAAVAAVGGFILGAYVESNRASNAAFDNMRASTSVVCDRLTAIALDSGQVSLKAETTQIGGSERPIAFVLRNLDGSIGKVTVYGNDLVASPQQGIDTITAGVTTSFGNFALCPSVIVLPK